MATALVVHRKHGLTRSYVTVFVSFVYVTVSVTVVDNAGVPLSFTKNVT